MKKNDDTQLSLTDIDANLMKNKDGFEVSFNAQTVVDTNTHIIMDCSVTNQVTDHGLLFGDMRTIREDTTGKFWKSSLTRDINKPRTWQHVWKTALYPM